MALQSTALMNVVILAGGFGTRLSEETSVRPKPMVEIGGKPILWHIMQLYAAHGFMQFIVAAGYKADVIKEYFSNFFIHNSDFEINLRTGERKILNSTNAIDWKVTVVDTGLETLTGGRIRRLRNLIGDQTFMVTYGDGLADLDIRKLVEFHRSHRKKATITAVPPPARFGALELSGERVVRFSEKPPASESWINGGFFILEPSVFDYIPGDHTSFEREPLERLAAEKELMAFRHSGFWHPMDTLRDRMYLEKLWEGNQAPWKTWR